MQQHLQTGGPVPIQNAPYYVPGYSGHIPRPIRQGVGGGVGGTYQPLTQQTSTPRPTNQQTTTMFNNNTINSGTQQQYQQQPPTSYVPQLPQQQNGQAPIENQNMNIMLDQYLQQFQQQYGPFSNSNDLQPMKVTTPSQFQPLQVEQQQASDPMPNAQQNRNQSDPSNFGFYGQGQPQQQPPQMFYSQMPNGDQPPPSSEPGNQPHFYPASEMMPPQTDQNGNPSSSEAPAPVQMMNPPPEVAQQIQEAVIAHIQQQMQQQGVQSQVKPMPSYKPKSNTAKKSSSKSNQPAKQFSGIPQNFAKQRNPPQQKRSEIPRRTTAASIYGSALPISASYSGHIPGVKLNTYGVTFGQAVNSTSQYREKYIHKKK